jgi:amino acid transporter
MDNINVDSRLAGTFFGFLTVVLSLAEMSSIAPTAGGQYHWQVILLETMDIY